ncbi:FmdB family zinc ribbon protein [Candidatus Solirubrobacter pratensis]|uniref:FmdB family zinc ribbon protein n=1 Tax=Candidatus Solirubrobacter pratensis TaxID=1298857 RepID=UPI00040A2D8C|nr:zinc ribbon domain-containing protein [Candidatus Solirubrobacter pratensis]
MPFYEFMCEGCGPFEELRPMADASDPAACPACGGEARRVFSPPGLALLTRPLRCALEREEKSAHEPDVVGEKRGRPMSHRHAPAPSWVLAH